MELDRGALSVRRLHHELDETQQGWLLGPPEPRKKDRQVDLGFVIVKSTSALSSSTAFYGLIAGFVLIGLPVIIAKYVPHKRHAPPPPDQGEKRSALFFFDAQKCEPARNASSSLLDLRSTFLEPSCSW
jgi:endoglucanase